MKPIQLLLGTFVLLTLLKVARKYKKRGMPALEFLSWALLWVGTGLIIAVPDITSFFAHLLGIGRGADLVLYSGLLIVFYLIFRIHLALDRLEQGMTEVVRALALERLTELTTQSPNEPTSEARMGNLRNPQDVIKAR
jgi:hypothetical protein